jgi:hypothetical protein
MLIKPMEAREYLEGVEACLKALKLFGFKIFEGNIE